MKRALLGLLSAGLLLTSACAAHADPSGIRYDARTHTYTNIGSKPAPAAPTATRTTQSTQDPDFVEYTLTPKTTAPAQPVAAPAVAAPVATATVAAPTSSGFSAYPTLGTPYSLGYSGGFYGAPGYLPYGYGSYGGYGLGMTGFYNYGRNVNRLPSVTNMWIPGMGTVQNINIPGFGWGGYGWGGGIAPCTYGAATVRVHGRVR